MCAQVHTALCKLCIVLDIGLTMITGCRKCLFFFFWENVCKSARNYMFVIEDLLLQVKQQNQHKIWVIFHISKRSVWIVPLLKSFTFSRVHFHHFTTALKSYTHNTLNKPVKMYVQWSTHAFHCLYFNKQYLFTVYVCRMINFSEF